MRTNLFVTLALLGLATVGSAASAEAPRKTIADSREIKKGHFGSVEISEVFEADENSMARVIKTVYPSSKPYIRDYERQTRALKQAKLQTKVNKERMADNKIYTCGNRGNVNPMSPDDPGAFIPVNVGSLNAQRNSITYTAGTCYKNIQFSFTQTGDGSNGESADVTLNISTTQAQSLFCTDWFFFATSSLQHIETFYLSGNHQITFKDLSPVALAEIQKSGIHVYMFCDGYANTLMSVYNSALAFYGGLGTDPNEPIYGSHIPDYMEKENVLFLSELMGYNLTERDT